MSKSIGLQIDKQIENQMSLEREFDRLIKERSKLTPLVDEEKIENLTKTIDEIANQLKNSTNEICKSLTENPEIPTNLKKAKDDKKMIVSKLENVKEDLRQGTMNYFNSLIVKLNENNSNIEIKRKEEKELLDINKKLDAQLKTETFEFNNDKNNLEKKLKEAKKELAKTKLACEVKKEYRDQDLDALKSLKDQNFIDEANQYVQLISDKLTERERDVQISAHIINYLKAQTQRVEKEKELWKRKKDEKYQKLEEVKKRLEDDLIEKQTNQEKLKKEIQDYTERIDKYLKDDSEFYTKRIPKVTNHQNIYY